MSINRESIMSATLEYMKSMRSDIKRMRSELKSSELKSELKRELETEIKGLYSNSKSMISEFSNLSKEYIEKEKKTSKKFKQLCTNLKSMFNAIENTISELKIKISELKSKNDSVESKNSDNDEEEFFVHTIDSNDLFTHKKIIMTPINLHVTNSSSEPSKKARDDYLREKPFFETGNAKWDDARYNLAKVGDYFAFVHQTKKGGDRMELFEITEIKGPENRDINWNIEEHKNRNVLYLSPMKSVIKFTEYKKNAGYLPRYKILGTLHGKVNEDVERIICYGCINVMCSN